MRAPFSPAGPARPRRRARRLALIGLLSVVATVVAVPTSEAATRTKGPKSASTRTSGVTTSTTGSTAAPTCGGAAIAKAGGGYWECTFADEFDGKALDTSKWLVQETATSGYHSGPECFVNTASNVSVSRGTLKLTVRKEKRPFLCAGVYLTQYTSGMVSTWGKFSQAYGRFEVRAKLPPATVRGLQESFWLYPQNLNYGAWPVSGEIDIAEVYSQYPDRAIPYIHYAGDSGDAKATNTACLIQDISKFHTYAVEWTPQSIKIIYDGTTCLVNDSWSPSWPLAAPQPFDQPFILILTQALGIGTNAFDAATTPLPATTEVDYARIWK